MPPCFFCLKPLQQSFEIIDFVVLAARLAEAPAALRDRPLPGLVELNEATQAVICFGNPLPMNLIHEQLIVGEALVGVYCATKAAVISLTQSAGLNLIRHGINVNAIAPGFFESRMTHDVLKHRSREITAACPLGRIGRPEDVARVVRLLLEPDAYVTGQVVTVDGGLTLRRDRLG